MITSQRHRTPPVAAADTPAAPAAHRSRYPATLLDCLTRSPARVRQAGRAAVEAAALRLGVHPALMTRSETTDPAAAELFAVFAKLGERAKAETTKDETK